MTTAASAKVTMLGRSEAATGTMLGDAGGSALAEFEQLYVGNFDVVMAYFARRCAEPQVVADLTSETFVRAGSLRSVWIHGGFPPAGYSCSQRCKLAK